MPISRTPSGNEDAPPRSEWADNLPGAESYLEPLEPPSRNLPFKGPSQTGESLAQQLQYGEPQQEGKRGRLPTASERAEGNNPWRTTVQGTTRHPEHTAIEE